MAHETPAGTLALLVKTFPKLSESFVLGEVLSLQQAGWPLIVYSLRQPADAQQQPAASGLRCPVVHLPEMSDDERIDWLAREWQRTGIAHVHAHFIDGTALLAARATQRIGIRFSISAHAKDIYLGDPALLAQLLRAAAFTVTCTEYNLRQLRQLAPADAVVSCNHHGVDTQYFAPRGPRCAPDPLQLLAVGRLRPKKGFATALRSLALLRSTGINARLTLVGYGPEEHALRELCSALGLEHQVEFTGVLSHAELRELYATHHVFIAPSEIAVDGDRDGIPNVLLEAMAAEMAVVASSVSGIPEALAHEQEGLLVEPADAAALAAAITRLARSADMRRLLGAAARRRVLRDFSLGAAQQRLSELLAPHLQLDALLATRPSADATVAYVVMGFPRRSEAFISSELLQLERLGLGIRVFAIKAGDPGPPHHSVRQLRARVDYLPALGSLSGTPFWPWLVESWRHYGAAHRRVLRRHPLRWLQGASRAVTMSIRYRKDKFRPRKVFIKEFLQAGAIADQLLQSPSLRHLHGHFCHGATTITWMAADLAGLPFSFTAHAKDLWQRDQNPGDLLSRKMQTAAFVVTCTEANRDQLRRCSTNHVAVTTIYHGLDTDFFRRDPTQRRDRDTPLLLAIGRLVEKKGFRYLLDACSRLRDEARRFRCVLVGEDGPEREVLERLIAAHDLRDCVEIRGPVDHHGLRGLYQQATLFVLPCLVAADGDRDGIPNVLAEAMAMELPVISTAVSGIPELVVDRECGLLVPERDATALAAALRSVLDSDALALQLATNARAAILRTFDATRTHVELKRLFDASLGRVAPAAVEEHGADCCALHARDPVAERIVA